MHQVNAEAGDVIIKKGLYVINPDFVQLRKNQDKRRLEGSEIFYTEANSSPIPLKKPGSNYKDPSSGYLDDFIYKNALEQTGDPAIMGALSGVITLLKPLLEPANLFKLIFLGAIAFQLIRGLMGG